MSLVPVKEAGSMSYKVSVLTATNYPVWAIKVQSVMDAYGLWGTVEPRALGEEPDAKKNGKMMDQAGRIVGQNGSDLVWSGVVDRNKVLKALTRKFKLHEDVSLYSIAKKCPPNFTGADMYALCADAWFHAAKRLVLAAEADPTPVKDEVESVVVEYEDFVMVRL
nr:peroxisome biogenesis protein 6 [Tanacetum cinerariifolium]